MPTNLPTDLLRTMIAIAETGSMVRATKRIFRTQSALSLQIKRLEELVQTQLFRRDGKQLLLTPAGEVLLKHAREILDINDRAVSLLIDETLEGPVRIGLVQDFAETFLVSVLTRFARLNKDVMVQVRVGNSFQLHELLANDRLDIGLYLADLSDPSAISVADMVWLGDVSLMTEAVLPIAVLESPCMCRDAGVAALEQAGVDHRIVLETPSLSVIMNAVKAGLAITCRPSAFLGTGISPLNIPHLPLPRVAYALHSRPLVTRSAQRVRDLLRAGVLEL